MSDSKRTYAEAVGGANKKPLFTHLEFNGEVEDLARFEKAYVGIVENPSMTYNILESFNFEGYFNMKVTPLDANLCLLEEVVDGELEYLAKKAKN